MDSAKRVTNEIFDALGTSKVDSEQYQRVLRVVENREWIRCFFVFAFVVCAAAVVRYALRVDGGWAFIVLGTLAIACEHWGHKIMPVLDFVTDESPLRSPWLSFGRFVGKWAFMIGVWAIVISIGSRITNDPHLQNERTAAKERVRVYNPSTEEEQTYTLTVHRSRSGDVVAWEFPSGGHIDVTSFVKHFGDESENVKTEDGREWTFERNR